MQLSELEQQSNEGQRIRPWAVVAYSHREERRTIMSGPEQITTFAQIVNVSRGFVRLRQECGTEFTIRVSQTDHLREFGAAIGGWVHIHSTFVPNGEEPGV